MATGKKEIQIRCKVVSAPRFIKIRRDENVIACDVCEGYPKYIEVCLKQAIQLI